MGQKKGGLMNSVELVREVRTSRGVKRQAANVSTALLGAQCQMVPVQDTSGQNPLTLRAIKLRWTLALGFVRDSHVLNARGREANESKTAARASRIAREKQVETGGLHHCWCFWRRARDWPDRVAVDLAHHATACHPHRSGRRKQVTTRARKRADSSHWQYPGGGPRGRDRTQLFAQRIFSGQFD